MTNKDYRTALDTALRELESLIVLEERLQDRMLSLRKTINVLSTLCQDSSGSDSGSYSGDEASARLLRMIESSISDDIFKVVTASPVPLTTTEIREELNKLGGSLAEQKNPLATINAVLNRLEEQGKVKQTHKGERRAWERTITPLSNPADPKYFAFDEILSAISGLGNLNGLSESTPPKTSDPLSGLGENNQESLSERVKRLGASQHNKKKESSLGKFFDK